MSRTTANIRDTARKARRDAELLRKSQRTIQEPIYMDRFALDGTRIGSTFVGYRTVPYRNIQHKPTGFATLMASVSHLDLTRASGAQLAEWARV